VTPIHPTNSERPRRHADNGLSLGPWWAIAGLASVAVFAVVLYTWMLSRNGMGNSYYAAAVKSASLGWKAFFFGSLDPGSFITVDKSPAAFWVPALFALVFGFSSWSILLPQALAGVASVLILHRLVRRWAGDIAALLAALAFALTPVAVLIFRLNNPDAFLTLFFLLAAWAVWSAGATWKLAAAGAAIGFALLTKMLEALLVLPALGLVYLVCGVLSEKMRLLPSLSEIIERVTATSPKCLVLRPTTSIPVRPPGLTPRSPGERIPAGWIAMRCEHRAGPNARSDPMYSWGHGRGIRPWV